MYMNPSTLLNHHKQQNSNFYGTLLITSHWKVPWSFQFCCLSTNQFFIHTNSNLFSESVFNWGFFPSLLEKWIGFLDSSINWRIMQDLNQCICYCCHHHLIPKQASSDSVDLSTFCTVNISIAIFCAITIFFKPISRSCLTFVARYSWNVLNPPLKQKVFIWYINLYFFICYVPGAIKQYSALCFALLEVLV